MFKSGFLVGLMFLSVLAVCSVANAYWVDIWPATADGSMDTYPDEGYAIGSEGNYRFTKMYHHFAYMSFGQQVNDKNSGYSDGPDWIPQGRQKGGVNDKADGVLLADWLVGKKAFHNVLYWRNASAQTCDPYGADGASINDPVVIMGFRVANTGPFVDRGTGPKGTAVDGNGNPAPTGYGGCCAGYTSPLLEGGENAPGAWRMGAPYVNRAGVLGYSANGDINESDAQHEYFKMSAEDTLHPQAVVKVGSAGFGTAGLGGNSTNSGLSGSSRWAFDYIVEKSDAMMINSHQMREADCTGYAGEEEPRDFAADGSFAEGWMGSSIDRCIIYATVTPDANTGVVECKGLVFSSVASAVSPALNTSCFGRDQGGGSYGPYVAVMATIDGDVDNDGACDVVDLLYLVAAFGSGPGDANFNPESDFNCDGYVDVVDLLTMVGSFGSNAPATTPVPPGGAF